MLLIVHADKTVTTIAGNLNIGDTAADIYVISPFPATQSCSLLYRLPSGEEGEPTFSQGTALGGDYGGAVYSFEIPQAFTKEVGSVQVMVSLVDTKGRRFVSDTVTFDVGGFVTLPFPDSEEQGADFAAQLEALALRVNQLTTAYENITSSILISPVDDTSFTVSVNLNGSETGIHFSIVIALSEINVIAQDLVNAHNDDASAHPYIRSLITQAVNAEKNDRIAEDTLLQNRIVASNEHIVENSKRITNIEQGLPSSQFVVESGTEMVKPVPPNACQYAWVRSYDSSITSLKLRGTNCFENNVGFIVNASNMSVQILEDGSLKLNGQNTTGGNITFVVSFKLCYLSGGYYRCAGLDAGVYAMVYNDATGFYQSISHTSTAVSIPEGNYNLIFAVRGANTTDYVDQIYSIMIYRVNSAEDENKSFVPYEVKEVPVEDLSIDQYVEVQGGGTITFENTDGAPVQNEVIFQLRGE